ncbi:hypothetical protein PINS_up016821 [Pythium insidiosum]|nr:hypothetical protein PINS_up016821 [Pythium insidiosum]
MSSKDVEDIIHLMESERGESSDRQNESARAKFNLFLAEHVDKSLTISQLSATHVTEELIGKFTTFLFNDLSIYSQTSLNYLSSIRRQLEKRTKAELYRVNPD